MLNNQVTALFVQENSVYKSLLSDCYDINRNALTYTGENPVICHPPCRSWTRLRHFAKPPPGEHELAFFAIEKIRENGGVLEHPASSLLFPCYLPYPGSIDAFKGFSICLDQFWFKHQAQKRTLLYICGCDITQIPAHPLRFDAIQYSISRSVDKAGCVKKDLSKIKRNATPIMFAQYLISIAQLCRKKI